MASPEVWRALPTMTWLMLPASTPLRESASVAAAAARSMAEMSLKCPLYSAIGVRAPLTMKMSVTRAPSIPPLSNAGTAHHIRSDEPACAGRQNEQRPDAPLDAEDAAGDHGSATTKGAENGRFRGETAHVVAGDRPGDQVPGEVQPDGAPQPLVPVIRRREEDAGHEDVGQGERGDAGVPAVQRGEDERGAEDGEPAAPLPQLLVDVAAEEQFFVDDGGDVDGDELAPRESVVARVP